MTISVIRRCLVLSAFCPYFICNIVLADISHYKEVLVSDRATNMGGAYAAVSDDASGAYYNPAGLVFGANDSMTSLSNTTNFVGNKYDNSVGNEAEEEEDWRYLINFAGYMKRLDDSVYGISYAIDDSTGVQQDQKFEDGTVINKVGDDRTYKYGLSWAQQLEEYFSFGTTVYMYHREYYLQKSRLFDSDDINETWSFEKQEGSELGFNLIGGIMWLPEDEFSIGMVVKKTFFFHAEHHFQTQYKAAGVSNVEHNTATDKNYRKMPLTVTLGIAWFPSPNTLITGDVDYHKIEDEDKVNVLNI